jgi:hypothetical protein
MTGHSAKSSVALMGFALGMLATTAQGQSAATDPAKTDDGLAALSALSAQLLKSDYVVALGTGGSEELVLQSVTHAEGTACDVVLHLSTDPESLPETLRVDFANEAVRVSTDFWGARSDTSVTLSRGGERGQHLSFFYTHMDDRAAAKKAVSDWVMHCAPNT